jgi:tetratricopeptide (TPR) repeat protein
MVMNPGALWQRATLLFSQRRYDLAAGELRTLLTAEPDHAPARALLALALAQLDDLDAALAEAKAAIAEDPELAFAHGAMAAVLFARDDHDLALAAIETAIRLDPDAVDHRSTQAQIHVGQKRWTAALAAADAGLALDPHDTDCLNLRSLALARLGRAAEATGSLDESLGRDPDNPYTHQARGFVLLQQGDAKGALHHFQEALRRDPSLDGARHGLLEALKARNPVYRLVLAWFLWLDRFDGRRQTQILVGIWFFSMVARRSLRAAGFTTAANVAGFAWLGFVLVVACAVPLCNLLLLLHPIGRHALDRQARNDALLLGGTVLTAAGIGLHRVFGESIWSWIGWETWLFFVLPVAGIGLFHAGWARRTLQTFCAAVGAAWVWWAFAIESHVAAVRRYGGGTGSVHAKVPDPDAWLEWLLQFEDWLTVAAALSTWFVLLAPKGKPARRAAN